MAFEVIMPKAGMSMETGTILKWLKKEGEEVSAGEPLLEIETDKVSMEVESEASGVLLRIVRHEGEEVPVTETIGYIGRAGEEVTVGPKQVRVLDGARGVEGTASEPDERRSPSGTKRRVAATPLARTLAAQRGVDLSEVRPSGARGEVKARDIPSGASTRDTNATPLARRIAGLEGVDLAGVKGSGRAGKITKRDVLESTGGAERSTRELQRSAMTSVRRTIAGRMAESHATIPPVTLNSEADVTSLLELKGELIEQTGTRYSFNDFILRAVALALRAHPLLMQQLDGEELVHPTSVDLGVAVSVDDLLLVPVIRSAHALSFAELAGRAHELIERTREKRLGPDDLGGATFTVTNLGMYGITDFTPIINPPESAILGVGAMRESLRLVDGEPRSCSKITLSLTIDHRIIDGVAGAKFLSTLRELLERPLQLLV